MQPNAQRNIDEDDWVETNIKILWRKFPVPNLNAVPLLDYPKNLSCKRLSWRTPWLYINIQYPRTRLLRTGKRKGRSSASLRWGIHYPQGDPSLFSNNPLSIATKNWKESNSSISRRRTNQNTTPDSNHHLQSQAPSMSVKGRNHCATHSSLRSLRQNWATRHLLIGRSL